MDTPLANNWPRKLPDRKPQSQAESRSLTGSVLVQWPSERYESIKRALSFWYESCLFSGSSGRSLRISIPNSTFSRRLWGLFRRLLKHILLGSSKMQTTARFTLSELQSCQRTYNWLDVYVASVPNPPISSSSWSPLFKLTVRASNNYITMLVLVISSILGWVATPLTSIKLIILASIVSILLR